MKAVQHQLLVSAFLIVTAVANQTDIQSIFTDKRTANVFLKSRHKRSASEECREGCYREEMLEIWPPAQADAYMLWYKCQPLACVAGCYTTNGDYSHINNLAVKCYPDCDLKANPSACDIYYSTDIQITKLGNYRWGIGTCVAQDVCGSCNDGFYGGSKYCYMCGQISHCNHRKCGNLNSNLVCAWCDGEIAERIYWRAYTGHLDNRISCQKTCSWRTDSTRCFPGTCASELAANCVCSPNFIGTHCEEITDLPPIVENHCIFYDDPNRPIEKIENDPNYINNGYPIIWSNFVDFGTIQTKMSAKYLQPVITLNADHYVRDFKVGLIEMKTTIILYRGGQLYDTKEKNCVSMSRDAPIDQLTCPQTFQINTFTNPSWVPLKHDDKIIYRVSATNGGYVKVHNRDITSSTYINTYYYNGKTTTREFEYHWDIINPYHCSAASGASCTPFLFIASDVTNNPVISFTWGGWSDDLSGIYEYHYDLFELESLTSALMDGKTLKQSGVLPNNSFSSSLTVLEPAVYSIHISAIDKAGNYKTGRGIFFFDDMSVVTLQGVKTKCTTASQNTSYEWVVQNTNTVKVIWTDRFYNLRHKNNGWLNSVNNMPAGAAPVYEDLYGNRTNKAINNMHGIVDYKVAYQVHDPSLKDARPLTFLPSSQLQNQNTLLTINWADGDQLNVTVQAYDILGVYNEDIITVYRDASPPIIQNLWLTKGDRLNVSVHSIEDFTKMTFEWEAYDDHSGLESVYWKLYDSYGTYIEHGHEDIIAQGHAVDLTDCQTKYASFPRGANCYCTAFMGCYHRHFQVKPEIKAQGGLKLNFDKGVHDYDYYIQISVTNKAMMKTTSTKKITIDVSPPHAGVVNDGIKGGPEIDFQQGMNLEAYWDQFFDRESGVFFYQYIVGAACADKTNFDLNRTHPNVIETYNTFGSHTATGDGTYYFTVVAYNRALDASIPVCSDGVTIDSSIPGVKEVVVKDSLITGGLITDSTQTSYYILGSDRVRRLIPNPTADCMSKATSLSNIDLYPVQRYENKSAVEVDGNAFCSNSSSAPTNIGITLFKSSLMELSWKTIDIPAKVYDFEVGLASTAGSAAPDIMSFQSSKQHEHFRITHENVPEATLFYVIIKTISKSNVEGLTTLGPCFMDTTPPDFTGSITVSLAGDHMVASWPVNAFSDSEELFNLKYEFSVGHTEYGTEIQSYKPIHNGATCIVTVSPTCTAVNISEAEWKIHGHHTYYISIKVTNTAGLVKIQTSSPYIHDVQLPTEGIVRDIGTQMITTDIPMKDIEDVDFQTDTTSMTARWSGFVHPHLDVTYKISIGSTKGGSDVISMKDVGSSLSYTETGLSLTPFQKYYWTVIAVSSAGNTEVSSDGVTIVTANALLTGVLIYDGETCNMTGLTLGHHESDNRIFCTNDIDEQMSLNSMKAYWTVPVNIQSYTTDAFIAIEKRSVVGNVWTIFREFVYVSTVFKISIDDLTLSSGVMYRLVLKLCAKTICFQTISTDGVMVMANPPATGAFTVEHLNTTLTGAAEKLMITMDKFYDPDIEDINEKYDAIWKYEYAITDNSVHGKTYTIWKNLVTFTTSGNQLSFEVQLDGTMDFSRCKRFSVRGYNKAKLYSVVSADIKDCNAFNPVLINPNIVIDAVGMPDAVDGIGRTIYLAKNALWTIPDEDYTPYKNLISAVWPSLRHRDYQYAIIDARTVDVTTYYKQINQLNLVDPCSHPDAIRCGSTSNEFMNEEFTNDELIHGTKYTVCVHANRKLIPRETWVEEIPAINACSDGIVVDFTPPTKGRVWISHNPGTLYQTSNTDIYVNWDGFQDIEEYNIGPHSSGIKEYILGIGTSKEGNDVHAFENVGVVQHKALHHLTLQNGYQYYATLKAVDFANRTCIAVSDAITVDTTPPETSNKPITISNRHITSRTEINPCWSGVFVDLESGIDYYMWSVGSEPGYTDMMPYMKVVGEECGETDENNPLDLQDGHYYYINVRAFNKAGLSILATSWAFHVETTPPTAGHVYDGDRLQLTGSVKDIDFQTETEVLHAYWEGFYESHSTIKEYYISVGTCPQCEDVLPEQAIGITYELTLENIHLGSGLRYYVTVTACNTADMCTSVTSDGVIIDNSPPTAGAVQDGVGFYDTEYQSLVNYISAKWYGFDDPQSGLAKYVWRVGTTQGGSDIVAETQLHVTETASILNILPVMPINRRIYVTVRAYNKLGLWSESSSNGFLVDITAPVITEQPTFSQDFGIKGLTQIYRTSMKIEWTADDPESFIKRQYLSIKSHIGGEFMLSSQPVNGIARSYVFTGLDLHDGVTYYVTLISCNSADICTTSTSPGMFVDSTPPSRGMFAITTDHAADPDLARHTLGWMTWAAYSLQLAWLGFSDVHSNISYYKVHVGSTYMGKDLNKDADKMYTHAASNKYLDDEGYVQLFLIDTEALTAYDKLFITVWAVNGAGVRSDLIHSAFTRVPGGALDLIRRCNAMSCEGHCVCAPQDQKCPYIPTIGQCTDISDYNVNNLLLVEDSNGYSTKDQAVTASDNVLRGMWLVSQRQGLKPLWYEWSVGYTSYNTPQGIYDLIEDKMWQDAGQLTDSVFSTKPGVKLHNTLSYSVFVRVWYSAKQYAIFKSNGIFVIGQAPALASTRGKTVIERVRGTTIKDIDYMQVGRPLTFDWNGKFLQAAETVQRYDIYLSTFPGGYDIMPVASGIPGKETAYNLSGITLNPGVVHYTNVIAYNYAGAHTTATSDGFMIDRANPIAGMVYDGIGTKDLEYKNSSSYVEAHWHGFTDTDSGIKEYHWCVGTTSKKDRKPENTECSIISWINVGLHVSVSRNISFTFTEDMKIYSKVYAIDNAGLKSQIVVSDGTLVDTTPPAPAKFVHMEENILDNPSFESTGGNSINWQNVSSTDICMVSNSYHPLSWIPTTFTCMAVVSSEKNLARNGRSFLFLRGSIYQHLLKVTSGKMYRISFFSSHLPILDSVASNKEGFVKFGEGIKQVFLIYTKSYRRDGHGESIGREEVSWHKHVYYFIATENMANITVGSMDVTTGILIDDFAIQEVNLTTGHISGHVNGHIVYLHEWSSIHGAWSFIDPESPIIDYTWAIGYSAGGTQIQPFRSAGLMNFGMNNNVTLVHNTYIYVTAIARNAAGLKGISYSDPILVDLTPPHIKFVYDGRGADEDAWTFNEVAANWDMEDLESGIKYCVWAIGYSPGSIELLEYTTITTKSGTLDFDYKVLEGYKIYTTLSCENNAGLITTKSSNGVRISNSPPSISAAQVEVVPISSTEYSPRDMYQGISDTLRVKWSGFKDSIGVETYQVKYQETKSETMFFPANQEVLYSHFTKMSMTDDVQSVAVQAMNKLYLKSYAVSTNVTIRTTTPLVDTSKTMGISWQNNQFVVSWNNVFSSSDHLFYEVSAGSNEFGVNILHWQFTNQTSVTFGIPAFIRVESGLEVYVYVRAISVGGFFVEKGGKFKFP